MMLKALSFLSTTCLFVLPAYSQGVSDSQIRQNLIQQSVREYSGSCPCPYNSASNGSRCGGRSAYSRPGGASPLCYEGDVSGAMIERYRDRNGLQESGVFGREEIRSLQRSLNSMGFDAGPVDGLFGPSTRQAIEAYQRSEGLPISGEIDQGLINSLN